MFAFPLLSLKAATLEPNRERFAVVDASYQPARLAIEVGAKLGGGPEGSAATVRPLIWWRLYEPPVDAVNPK